MDQISSPEEKVMSAPKALFILSLLVGTAIFLLNIQADVNSDLLRLTQTNPLLRNLILNKLVLSLLLGLAGGALVWGGAVAVLGIGHLPFLVLRVSSAIGFFFLAPWILICVIAGPQWTDWTNSFHTVPQWQALPRVPEPAVQIEAANHSVVYVRGESGKIYGCNADAAPCWYPAPETLTLLPSDKIIPVGQDAAPPKSAVSTIGVSYAVAAEIGACQYYAVLSDGSVWSYRTSGPDLKPLLGWITPLGTTIAILFCFVPVYLGALSSWGLQRRSRPPAVGAP